MNAASLATPRTATVTHVTPVIAVTSFGAIHTAPAEARSGVDTGRVVVAHGGCTDDDCACGHRQQWSYTVGLVAVGLPELVVTGLAPAVARALLHDVHVGWPVGARPQVDVAVLLSGYPVVLRNVPPLWLTNEPSRMASWMERYGVASGPQELPEVVQVLWGDRDGRFPGDPACDPLVAEDQPVLAADPFGFPRRASRRTRRIPGEGAALGPLERPTRTGPLPWSA